MPQTLLVRVAGDKLEPMVKTPTEAKRCKRGCCWTPYDVCAGTYKCRCHAQPIGNLSARIRLEDFLDSLGDDE